jgi:hypothetical protein
LKAGKVLSRLVKFPLSGRYLPEFPDLPFREVIVAQIILPTFTFVQGIDLQ